MDPITGKKIIPIKDNIIVKDMNFGERTSTAGIVLLSDDAKSSGIRPRWGKVYAIGPEQKDIKVNEWILVSHGRWTRGVKFEDPDTKEIITIRRVDVNDVLMVSSSEPAYDTTINGDAI